MSYNLPLTLEIVKSELGITEDTYDAKITERIPYAESKFREIANYQFNYVFCPVYESGSNIIKVYQGANSQIELINYGDIILSPNHADGTYVTQNFKIPQYDEDGSYYELKVSTNATDNSDTYGTEAVLCYNQSHYAVLSQIVWYMIGEQDTSKVGEKGVKSKTYGPVSVTYGDGDVNQTYGLPNKIVNQIPKYEGMY